MQTTRVPAPDCRERSAVAIEAVAHRDILGFYDAGPRQSLLGEQSEMMSDSGLYRQSWDWERLLRELLHATLRSRSVLQLASCDSVFLPDACRLDSNDPAR